MAIRTRISLDVEKAPPSISRESHPYGLTDREMQVLRLLATGRSNPQITRELLISPKTAGIHVSRILAKLGVANRVQAAGVAQRLALRDGGAR